jgi:hypothetical protein
MGTTHILFIGNSHTYCNGLPYQVRAMANAAAGGEAFQTWMCAAGGVSLGWHAREFGTRMNLLCNRWDFVVLQQKTHPFDGYAQLAADYAEIKPLIAQSGATPLLFTTWQRKDGPASDQDELDAAFERLGRENGARAVPVGAAWRRARAARPEIELYAADERHASAAGTYLAACMIFSVVTGRSPLGLPARIAANELLLADLPPAHADALQHVAAEALSLQT